MTRPYRTQTVNDEVLDRMLDDAYPGERAWYELARFVSADYTPGGRDAGEAMQNVIGYLVDDTRENHGQDIDGDDVLKAADAYGLVLGTVFESRHSADKIVEPDYDACISAIAGAAIAAVARWGNLPLLSGRPDHS